MNTEVFKTRSAKCNGLDNRDVTVLIAELERLSADNAAIMSAKVIQICPPALPESELVGHLQKLLADAHRDQIRMQQSFCGRFETLVAKAAGLKQHLEIAHDALAKTEAATCL